MQSYRPNCARSWSDPEKSFSISSTEPASNLSIRILRIIPKKSRHKALRDLYKTLVDHISTGVFVIRLKTVRAKACIGYFVHPFEESHQKTKDGETKTVFL